MVIDLTSLIVGNVDELSINQDVVIPDSYCQNTDIRNLENTKFCGKVVRLSDNTYQIVGNLTGIMILPDDVTLEDVSYSYRVSIDEVFCDDDVENNLQIVQNKLDITEFLWQNILVEVPSKVKGNHDDLTLEGDGWRLITEEDLESRNDSPFSELNQLFDSRKE